MTTVKALLGALVVTIVSVVLLTLSSGGMPSVPVFLGKAAGMFLIAFCVLRFTGNQADKSNNKGT